MNVVAHLFALVPKDTIRPAAHGTNHQIREKTVQLGSSMRRSRKTSATKRYRRYSKVAPVFMDENVPGDLRRAKEGMLRVIDAHGLGNARLIFVAGFVFQGFLRFARRRGFGRAAITFFG